jgi:enoyl-CoA hydratase
MTLTINRPHVKNAVNRAVTIGLAEAIDELDGNDAIRVAVLQAAGDCFSSGMDLKAFVNGEYPYIEGRGFAGLTEAPPRKPLICAVEGFALAGGFEMALCCDLVVAALNARFGIPEVKRGLVAAGGGLVRMPRQMPQRVAMEMALTGDPISAVRAYELGLVNELTEPGEALAAATALAGRIIENGPRAVMVSKEVIGRARDWSEKEMFARQHEI